MPAYCPAQICHRSGRPLAREDVLSTARNVLKKASSRGLRNRSPFLAKPWGQPVCAEIQS